MKRFWDGLAGVLLVLWIGGMWAIGYVAAPVLFASLDDKQLAGNLAGKLFELGAWMGLAAASYLLVYRIVRDGGAALKTLFFWVVALMLALTVASHFGIAPIMQGLKDQAMPLAVMQSVFADRFARWHGVSSIVYLIQSALGLLLVWRAGLAR
jgi:membrane protease YdiL (CAAX protease family)